MDEKHLGHCLWKISQETKIHLGLERTSCEIPAEEKEEEEKEAKPKTQRLYKYTFLGRKSQSLQ